MGAPTPGPVIERWASSLDRQGYAKRVGVIREAIAAGDVYQVNLCRRLSAPVPVGFDILGLGAALGSAHAAPHSAVVSLPSVATAYVASASPERFLAAQRRHGRVPTDQGTAPSAAGLGPKDRAENVMIVDLVRNDLGRVCEYGSVEVPGAVRGGGAPGARAPGGDRAGRLGAATGGPTCWRRRSLRDR